MILTVPGDKSVSQRALILSALTHGPSRISGLLGSEDPRSTASALRALGATIPPIPADGSPVVVEGRGLRGLAAPDTPLDLGNSGTGARLLLGVLAGQPFTSTVTGDESLRSRPMRRVTGPLSQMGARFRELEGPDRLPLEVVGGPLRPVELDLAVASAQVKSALLLAGGVGGVFVLLTEPGRSRDHTERMLRAAGVSVITHAAGPGMRVEMRDPPDALASVDWEVPGDFSSAAFFLVLALLGGAGPSLVIRDVGLNPTRTGLLGILARMGGRFEVEPHRPDDGVGEPIGLIRGAPSEMAATTVEAAEVPTAIDELPLVAVAAARAAGVTRITGAAELRVKETDRIRALAEGLRAVGAEAEELEDGLEVRGTDAPLRGRVRSHGDHRIAMAFGVLGALPGNEIHVEGAEVVEVSYPGFWQDLRQVVAGDDAGPWRDRADARAAEAAHTTAPNGTGSAAEVAGSGTADATRTEPPPARPAVVTVDGPAGSGKSTTAREVARRLGYRHLDSGALYRALTWALLDRNVDPDTWPDLDLDDLDHLDVRMKPVEGGFRISAGGRTLDSELRGPEVTSRVSELASLPVVRRWLLGLQRQAGGEGGLVADGRDMGTVVFPDADVKIFLTADLAERARRRLREREEGSPPHRDAHELEQEAERIGERDRRDSEREFSPLRRPAEAVVLDTTELDFDEQVQRVVEEVEGWESAGRSGEPGRQRQG